MGMGAIALLEKQVRIELIQGLAARQAAHFVRIASTFSSDVKIGRDNQFVDAKSILGVMSMAFAKGEIVQLRTEGHDEVTAMEALEKILVASE